MNSMEIARGNSLSIKKTVRENESKANLWEKPYGPTGRSHPKVLYYESAFNSIPNRSKGIKKADFGVEIRPLIPGRRVDVDGHRP